eukprot:jgi/Chrzof1/5578/Cz16g07350.t1
MGCSNKLQLQQEAPEVSKDLFVVSPVTAGRRMQVLHPHRRVVVSFDQEQQDNKLLEATFNKSKIVDQLPAVRAMLQDPRTRGLPEQCELPEVMLLWDAAPASSKQQ